MKISMLKKWTRVAFPVCALFGLCAGLGAVACQKDEQAKLPSPDRQVSKPVGRSSAQTSPSEPNKSDGTRESKSDKPSTTAPAEQQQKVSAAELHVKRLVVTSRVEAREPVETDSFTADGEPVLAFVELKNAGDTPQRVVITFEHERGERVGHVKLDVPASTERWRTWGKTGLIRRAGRWTAVVSLEDGTKLAESPFVVGAHS